MDSKILKRAEPVAKDLVDLYRVISMMMGQDPDNASTLDSVRQLVEDKIDQALQAPPPAAPAAVPFERLDQLARALHENLAQQFKVNLMNVAIYHVIRAHMANAVQLHQRVWDLLRLQRHKLFESKAITKDEYTFLTIEAPYFEAGDPNIGGQGSVAVQRLERYDDQTNRMQVMRTRVARVIVLCPTCNRKPNQETPECSVCQALRAILKDALGPDWMEDPALAQLKAEAERWEKAAAQKGGPVVAQQRSEARADAFRQAIEIMEGRA